jgi:hypothetical protein
MTAAARPASSLIERIRRERVMKRFKSPRQASRRCRGLGGGGKRWRPGVSPDYDEIASDLCGLAGVVPPELPRLVPNRKRFCRYTKIPAGRARSPRPRGISRDRSSQQTPLWRKPDSNPWSRVARSSSQDRLGVASSNFPPTRNNRHETGEPAPATTSGVFRGTKGSNPASSSRESIANLTSPFVGAVGPGRQGSAILRVAPQVGDRLAR